MRLGQASAKLLDGVKKGGNYALTSVGEATLENCNHATLQTTSMASTFSDLACLDCDARATLKTFCKLLESE